MSREYKLAAMHVEIKDKSSEVVLHLKTIYNSLGNKKKIIKKDLKKHIAEIQVLNGRFVNELI
ncbi:hypothetical protein GCM10011339_37390 [Echinicola rosea]|uniref:Uncharacterized protein n=1 Tax=Echinicola rosea TaxID=1807691 RepID=A0ABQ1VBE1_9BACT|nr:hypothetical protein GCM10011339_37390 [Echinicola rosea]